MYIYLPNAPLFDVNNLLFASITKGVITYPQLIIQENLSGAIFFAVCGNAQVLKVLYTHIWRQTSLSRGFQFWSSTMANENASQKRRTCSAFACQNNIWPVVFKM